MNEQEEFLKSLENDQSKQVDILEQPLAPEEPAPETTTEEEVPTGDDEGTELKPRNRRERRLQQKLQEERESSIFLAGKLEAISAAKKDLSEESDYLKGVERIFGTETLEAQSATDLLKKAIVGARDEAEERAFERFQEERKREQEALAEAERQLDSIIEDVEDAYNVTLTDSQQRSFFQLLQKMSPKDQEGNVVEYADPHAVWEIFQEKMQRPGTDNRAKSLSSRSMVAPGAAKESTLMDDQQAKYLREHGII